MRSITSRVASAVVTLSLLGAANFVQASTLGAAQVSAIVGLLQSFNADPSTIASVSSALSGQVVATTNGSCVNLSYTLLRGSKDATTNGQVTKLQQFLGISPTTGYFGPLTEAGVQQWQSSHGIVSSGSPSATGYGVVGPKTRSAMSCGTNTVVFQTPAVSAVAPTASLNQSSLTTGSATPVITGTASSNATPLFITISSGSISLPTNALPTSLVFSDQSGIILSSTGTSLTNTFTENTIPQLQPGTYTVGIYAQGAASPVLLTTGVLVVGQAASAPTATLTGSTLTSSSPTPVITGTASVSATPLVFTVSSGAISLPTTALPSPLVFMDQSGIQLTSSGTAQINNFTESNITQLQPGTYTIGVYTGGASPVLLTVGVLTITAATTTTTATTTATSTVAGPQVSSISPAMAPIGQVVTLTGTNFAPINSIYIGGGYTGPVPSSQNGTALTFTVPSSLSACDPTIYSTCTASSITTVPGAYTLTVNSVPAGYSTPLSSNGVPLTIAAAVSTTTTTPTTTPPVTTTTGTPTATITQSSLMPSTANFSIVGTETNVTTLLVAAVSSNYVGLTDYSSISALTNSGNTTQVKLVGATITNQSWTASFSAMASGSYNVYVYTLPSTNLLTSGALTVTVASPTTSNTNTSGSNSTTGTGTATGSGASSGSTGTTDSNPAGSSGTSSGTTSSSGTTGTTGTANACVNLTYNFSAGATDATTNGQVTALQNFLGVTVTGTFGTQTQTAVQAWQASHNLVSSGSPSTTGYGAVGPQTRASMACAGANIDSSQNANTTSTTAAAAPTNLTASCVAGGTSASISWNPVTGALAYLAWIYPFMKCPTGWTSNSNSMCTDILAGTSIPKIPTSSGVTYQWGVYANTGVASPDAIGPNIACGADAFHATSNSNTTSGTNGTTGSNTMNTTHGTNTTTTTGTTPTTQVAPSITSITPTNASVGQMVTITGSNFQTNATGANSIHFGNYYIGPLVSLDGTMLTFTIPNTTANICETLVAATPCTAVAPVIPGTYTLNVDSITQSGGVQGSVLVSNTVPSFTIH